MSLTSTFDMMLLGMLIPKQAALLIMIMMMLVMAVLIQKATFTSRCHSDTYSDAI
jgi:hypothetical protein